MQFLVESSSWLIFVSTEVIAGERQAEELGASLAAEMMFYAVASAVLANEVDTSMELSFNQLSCFWSFGINLRSAQY